MDWADPDNFAFSLAYSKGGITRWAYYENPDADDLVERARGEVEAGDREDLYRDMEMILQEDAPYILLHQPLDFVLRRDTVKGITLNPATCNTLRFSEIYKDNYET